MDEKDIKVSVRPPSTSSDADSEGQQTTGTKWAPGFVAQFPWLGFASLVTVLLCLAASIAILEASDGKPQASWPKNVQPHVLINIMNGIANIAFSVAIGNGIAISWWRKALKGSSIADLQRSWAFSTSIGEVLFSLKYFNIIALAALAAKLTIIDSTLMQEATSTYTAMNNPVGVTNLTGVVSSTFPITGTVGATMMPGLMMHWMGDTLKLWSQMGGFYPNMWDGCDGLCYLEVPAIGFAFECDEPSSTPINFGKQIQEATSTNANRGKTPSVFDIDFGAVYVDGSSPEAGIDSSYLEMNVSYTQADSSGKLSCPGKKYKQSCKLWPAIVKYPVEIQNSKNSIGSMGVSIGPQSLKGGNDSMSNEDLNVFDRESQQQKGFEVLRRLPILESHAPGSNINSSLAGIQLGLMMYIKSQSTLSWDPSGGFVVHQMGHAANYMTEPPSDPELCNFWYNNPLDAYYAPNGLFSVPSVIGKINQIMFGLATDVSEDNSEPGYNQLHSFNGTLYKDTIHFETKFAYMWGAIACTLACVLLTLPVFWGFWELGRKVTLGPFEIAHAFRSPIVAQATNPTTNEIVKEVGAQQIKYGPIVSGAGLGLFAVSEPQNVGEVPSRPGLATRPSWMTSPRLK